MTKIKNIHKKIYPYFSLAVSFVILLGTVFSFNIQGLNPLLDDLFPKAKATAGQIQVLVVGGGGGGGNGYYNGNTYGGGGGGGGGFIYNAAYSIGAGSYTVTIGSGGGSGTNGGNSVFGSLTATGGGYGGSGGCSAGASGGSGGGGGGGRGGTGCAGGSGSQGYAGGTGATDYGQGAAGGGGGGAGGAGGAGGVGSGGSSTPGSGGAGVANSISGSSYTYAPGAVGGAGSIGGYPNTPIGSGGMGGAYGGTYGFFGASGNKGIVIVSYVTTDWPGYTITGGVITTNGVNTIHTFASSGTFTIAPTTYPALGSMQMRALVVGGGGAGGIGILNGIAGGGGGAGGYIYDTNHTVAVGSYPITVGYGGSGYSPYNAGANSVFDNMTAIGGGAGGTGTAGGSGGGGSGSGSSGQTGGSGTSGQGYAGGNGVANYGAGGGGGASSAGQAGVSGQSGSGGNGITNGISGFSVTYAGGGGGGTSGATPPGLGGSGDGGHGGQFGGGIYDPTPGRMNSGSGGGGGGNESPGNPANGGSGIVIISYPTASWSAYTITGGRVTTDGVNTVRIFTTSGTLTIANNPNPGTPPTVSAVVVGGGGSGGGCSSCSPVTGSGGGAGGYQYNPYLSLAPGAYPVTIGAGGSSVGFGSQGNNSVFYTMIARGGGGGVPGGATGGFGGGSGGGANAGGTSVYYGGLSEPQQGNPGGNGIASYYNNNIPGGGGGAGAGGYEANSISPGGNGGVGVKNPITGSTAGQNVGGIYYLAGGGAGAGPGGLGGGGSGGSSPGASGTPNTGGGGGGTTSGFSSGGAGGSGVVVIAYPTDGSTGVSTSSTGGTITQSGGYQIHTFTSSGTFTLIPYPLYITSPTATSVTSSGATLGANLVSTGGSGISARGTCWGTSPAPTTNCLAEGGTSTGVFTQARTGMPANTLIYYRGYATNGIGTGYSADGILTTTAPGVAFARVLVVAGGGAGGDGDGNTLGGGGGAGGYQYDAAHAVTAKAYSVTVGNGGTAVGLSTGNSGGNSVFDNIIAIGGGGGAGGTRSTSGSTISGSYGGSGGGGAGANGGSSAYGSGYGEGGVGLQGYNGGKTAGGGGGAGAAGANTAGAGGAGLANSITGSSVTYAGGGGGASTGTGGVGGAGGGGHGGITGITAGTANTGGGGGGGGMTGNGGGPGGAGGSGIVIISYVTADWSAFTVTGGTVTTSGANTIRTFTSSGTLNISFPSPPTTTAINPTSGLNNASVSITSVTGTNYVSGATVSLTKSGQTAINCTGFTFTNSTTLSSGTCPITGAATGTWNVVVTNPDTQTGTLTNGFTVNTLSAPTVTSPTATSITGSGATLGANITSNGGASITARGTCWGTTAAPTDNCAAEGGTATGVFTQARTGMQPGTYIYYRGYATNSVGTGYSADGNFTTSSTPAATGSLTSVTFDTGYANGVTFNSLLWQGTLGLGTSSVQFQFASSNCSNGASNPPTCTTGDTVTGNIDATNHWAWNDTVGWLDFSPVVVSSTNLTKWAIITGDSSYISVDCATTPPSQTNICSTTGNYTVSDNSNNLAGFAWHDTYGWISFCGNASGGSTWDGTKWNCPASPTYQVTVDPLTGNFSGWAWNDILGWISVCGGAGTSSCPGSISYKVQISGASGLWSYTGPGGTTSSSDVYQPTGPGVPMPLVSSQHNNKRYFRYKIILNEAVNSTTPTVNDVIVNWSP